MSESRDINGVTRQEFDALPDWARDAMGDWHGFLTYRNTRNFFDSMPRNCSPIEYAEVVGEPGAAIEVTQLHLTKAAQRRLTTKAGYLPGCKGKEA